MAEAYGNRTHHSGRVGPESDGFEVRGGHQPSFASVFILRAERTKIKLTKFSLRPNGVTAQYVCLLLLAAGFFATGCGVKKDPLPPLKRVPHPAVFVIKQTGPNAVISGKIEPLNRDGSAMESARLTIFRAERSHGGAGFPSGKVFLEFAKIVGEQEIATAENRFAFSFTQELTEAEIRELDLFYAIEVKNERGRKSALSEIIRLMPKPFALPPTDLTAEVSEKFILLSWTPPSEETEKNLSYAIFRREGAGEWRRLNETPLAENEYRDATFRFGASYSYRVHSLIENGAQSVASESIALTPKDEFPPAPPTGLSASVEGRKIKLFWFPNEEADLSGYNIYRKEGNKKFEKMNEQIWISTVFEDDTAVVGGNYTYRITAEDKSGNESAPSETVERMMRAEPLPPGAKQ